MSTTLLPIDASRTLEEVELVIERGLVTFIEVGKALFEIKENRLYRQAGFTDFDAYCQTRWGWQRAHAYRLMDAANVAEALSPTGDTPSTERQARELNRLKDPDAIRAAWDEARERYSEQPTSAQLREVVDERLSDSDAVVDLETGEIVEDRDDAAETPPFAPRVTEVRREPTIGDLPPELIPDRPKKSRESWIVDQLFHLSFEVQRDPSTVAAEAARRSDTARYLTEQLPPFRDWLTEVHRALADMTATPIRRVK